jgi:hypothetical protein
MPIILTKPEGIEAWLSAPTAEALKLRHPLPDDALRIVARGKRGNISSFFALAISFGGLARSSHFPLHALRGGRGAGLATLANSKRPAEIERIRFRGFTMHYEKYNRRVRSAQWAEGYLKRARTYRSASRAAAMISALEHWLNTNPPLAVTAYTESD